MSVAATLSARPAGQAYDAIAPYYDDVTSDHDYELWTGELERVARLHGLSGTRLLDVACGTGKSFLPFLARGWEVHACDISAGMVAKAALKAGDRVDLRVIDMRSLPRLGSFDLITCLDDAVNYLDGPDELARAFGGMRRNLAPGGLVVFDCTTLHAYRTCFTSVSQRGGPGGGYTWRGEARVDLEPGAAVPFSIELPGDGAPVVSRHCQRHHPPALIRRALADAGLEVAGLYGHGFDGRPRPGLDELVHTKAIYVARHRVRPEC